MAAASAAAAATSTFEAVGLGARRASRRWAHLVGTPPDAGGDGGAWQYFRGADALRATRRLQQGPARTRPSAPARSGRCRPPPPPRPAAAPATPAAAAAPFSAPGPPPPPSGWAACRAPMASPRPRAPPSRRRARRLRMGIGVDNRDRARADVRATCAITLRKPSRPAFVRVRFGRSAARSRVVHEDVDAVVDRVDDQRDRREAFTVGAQTDGGVVMRCEAHTMRLIVKPGIARTRASGATRPSAASAQRAEPRRRRLACLARASSRPPRRAEGDRVRRARPRPVRSAVETRSPHSFDVAEEADAARRGSSRGRGRACRRRRSTSSQRT